MPRLPGFQYDTSGFQQANNLLMRGAENAAEADGLLGRSIGGGLLSIGGSIRAGKERRSRERQDQQALGYRQERDQVMDARYASEQAESQRRFDVQHPPEAPSSLDFDKGYFDTLDDDGKSIYLQGFGATLKGRKGATEADKLRGNVLELVGKRQMVVGDMRRKGEEDKAEAANVRQQKESVLPGYQQAALDPATGGMTQQQWDAVSAGWLNDPKATVTSIESRIWRERAADARDRGFQATQDNRSTVNEDRDATRALREDAAKAKASEAVEKSKREAVEHANKLNAPLDVMDAKQANFRSNKKTSEEVDAERAALGVTLGDQREKFIRSKSEAEWALAWPHMGEERRKYVERVIGHVPRGASAASEGGSDDSPRAKFNAWLEANPNASVEEQDRVLDSLLGAR